MGLMEYREPNQVKWVGVRPGHKGEQVLEDLFSNVAGDVLIYTVPAGKTLFLTNIFLGMWANISGIIGLSIFDTTPVRWKWLCVGIQIVTDNLIPINKSYYPPIEIPSGYHIYRYSANADTSIACIHGWVE